MGNFNSKFDRDRFRQLKKEALLDLLDGEHCLRNELRNSIEDTTKEIDKLKSRVDGLNTLNEVLSKRIGCWKEHHTRVLEAHINLCATTDLGLNK